MKRIARPQSLASEKTPPPMVLTLFEGARRPTPLRSDEFTSWADVLDAIADVLEADAPDKTQLPALGPYKLRDGASRSDANVEHVSLLALDVDRCELGALEQAIESAGVAALVYGSPSDDDTQNDARRVRVLAPIDRAIKPDECADARLRFAEALGLAPGVGVEQALDLSRVFFVGRINGSPERYWREFQGAPVAVDSLLARDLKHDWRPPKAPRDTPSAAPTGAPMASPEAIARAMQAALTMPPSIEGQGGDRALLDARNAIAEALGDAAEDPANMLAALTTFSSRCQPPWDTAKLAREAREAAREACDPTARALRRAHARHLESFQPVRPMGKGAGMCEVDEAIEALASPEAGLFQRAGALVDVVREAELAPDGTVRPEGTPRLRETPSTRIKELVAEHVGSGATGLVPIIIARGQWQGIRPIKSIVSYPVLRPDGTVLSSTGYDAATGTLAELPRGFELEVGEKRKDAQESLAVLLDVVSDFPFDSDVGRASWLAMLLTVLARPAISGPTPMGLFEASTRGAGKTLLADLIAIIATGSHAPRRVAPKTREEWDKSMLTVLMAGDPIVLFDNITNMLVTDALDAVLTGTTYTARVLGASEERRLDIRAVFMATANNARISTDLVRRTIAARLEPTDEAPELRPAASFTRPDIDAWTLKHREALLSAALTILRAYAVAGRPSVDTRPTGSYRSWSNVVRDAIVWAGGADATLSQEGLRDNADVEREELAGLLEALWDTFGEEPFTAKNVVERAWRGPLHDALREALPAGSSFDASTVGFQLRKAKGQRCGGLRLERSPRGKTRSWNVVKA